VGAPRAELDWSCHNPKQAALDFVSHNPAFVIEDPPFLFNKSKIAKRVTYWPSAFIKRLR